MGLNDMVSGILENVTTDVGVERRNSGRTWEGVVEVVGVESWDEGVVLFMTFRWFSGSGRGGGGLIAGGWRGVAWRGGSLARGKGV